MVVPPRLASLQTAAQALLVVAQTTAFFDGDTPRHSILANSSSGSANAGSTKLSFFKNTSSATADAGLPKAGFFADSSSALTGQASSPGNRTFATTEQVCACDTAI